MIVYKFMLLFRPRLGPLLPKVLGVSSLYLTMSLMESYFRLSSNMSAEILLVELPLAALDSGIVCWIFAALTQTTRALRLRRYYYVINIIQCLILRQ